MASSRCSVLYSFTKPPVEAGVKRTYLFAALAMSAFVVNATLSLPFAARKCVINYRIADLFVMNELVAG